MAWIIPKKNGSSSLSGSVSQNGARGGEMDAEHHSLLFASAPEHPCLTGESISFVAWVEQGVGEFN